MGYSFRTLLSVSFFVILFGIIGVYSFGRARALFFGPVIEINSPAKGVHTNDAITVSGTVKNAARITLNDRLITTDPNGHFSEKLLLLYGYNIIEVEAIDRFGTQERKLLQIVYR